MPKEVITSETCRSCGACCLSLEGQDRYCDVTVEDMKRMSKKFVREHVIPTSPFDMLLTLADGMPWPDAAIATKLEVIKAGGLKGLEVCKCAALRGSVMHRTSCSIYENRPDVCKKAVKPGDRDCRWLRKELKRIIKERAA